MEIDVNLWTVLAAAVASMVVGGLWYSPLLFGKMWMGLMGFSPERMESMKMSANKGYALGFITALLISYVLAHFVAITVAVTVSDALTLGFWIWLGFIATVMAGIVIWEGKPWKLYILNIAYQLVSIELMSVILTLWQ